MKRELSAEARRWVDEGLVSEDQASKILARYGAELPTGTERSFGYSVLSALAALFVGLALVLLVSENWDEIPRGVRMGSLGALTLGLHLYGVRAFKRGNEGAAAIAAFLGCLAYGTSIFLIAQIYHLGEHYPDGIFWWALGSLPFALLLRSLPIAFLGLFASLAWMISQITEEMPPFAWPVLAAPLLWFCWKQRESKIVFSGLVVGTAFWVEMMVSYALQGTMHRLADELLALSFGIFVVLHALGRTLEDTAKHEVHAEYGALLRLWAVRAGLIALLIYSFDGAWRSTMDVTYEQPVWLVLIAGTTVALTGAISAYYLKKRPEHRRRLIAVGLSLFGALLVMFAGLISDERAAAAAFYLQVFTNLAALGVGIWLIVRALEDALTHYFYAGLGLILAIAFLRYIDLVDGYIGGALLFLIFAGILGGAARFWRLRMEKRA